MNFKSKPKEEVLQLSLDEKKLKQVHPPHGEEGKAPKKIGNKNLQRIVTTRYQGWNYA